MADLQTLISGLQDADKAREYFREFFRKENFRNYRIPEGIDPDSRKAIRILFVSGKDLLQRADEALSFDPLCVEAFFIFYMLSPDIDVDLQCRFYYGQIDEYGDLDTYQQSAYLQIMSLYVEFLIDIGNYSRAIRIEKQILKLGGEHFQKSLDRLCFLYSALEIPDDFYRLYLDYEFNARNYILLILTLLKHEDELRAKEVCEDMFEHIEYASYLDHLWDLEEDDPAQKEYLKICEELDSCMAAVPDFLSFINRVREKRDL